MSSKSILIIEDNPINLKLVYIVLSKEGYLLKTATHAEEALMVLKTFHPRLIVMDLQLPGMDGFQLTKMLKQDPRTRDIIIVALTAYAMKGDEERALRAGCDDYLAKPVDIHFLTKTLARYLKGGDH